MWGWLQPVNNSPLLTLVDAYAHLQELKPHFKRFKGFFNLQSGRPRLIAVVTLHGGYVGIGTRIQLAFGPSSRFFPKARSGLFSSNRHTSYASTPFPWQRAYWSSPSVNVAFRRSSSHENFFLSAIDVPQR